MLGKNQLLRKERIKQEIIQPPINQTANDMTRTTKVIKVIFFLCIKKL